MKARVAIAYPAATLAVVGLAVSQPSDCGTWQTLAVFLLGMVLPRPQRALQEIVGKDDQENGS